MAGDKTESRTVPVDRGALHLPGAVQEHAGGGLDCDQPAGKEHLLLRDGRQALRVPG